MQELLILVAKKSPDSPLEVCGCVTRDAAHLFGFPHTSILLVPVTWDRDRMEPVVFLHKRSPYKRISPNAWDFCGGHLTFDESYFPEGKWDSPYDLGRATDDAAVREANEELRCTPPFTFLPEHVRRFQPIGYFECETASERGKNREFSSVYIVAVPPDRIVTIWDTDTEGERQLEVRRFTWSDLLMFYQKLEFRQTGNRQCDCPYMGLTRRLCTIYG